MQNAECRKNSSGGVSGLRSEEHTSELQSQSNLVCRLLLEKKILLNELLRTFVYAPKFTWMDPLYPLVYCLVVIIGLCAFQAFRVTRNDFVDTLKGIS